MILGADNEYVYRSHGLTIRSVISLPGLRRAGSRSTVDGSPELSVKIASLPSRPGRIDTTATKVYGDPDGRFAAYRTEQSMYWFHDGVGTLRVTSGREIVVSPLSDTEARRVSHLVLALGIRTALVQRGTAVLHAATVVVDGSAVAFTGPSGRGKSTTAAACYANGHPVHTEDVTPLELTPDAARIPPGSGRLCVEEDVATKLGLETSFAEPSGEVSVDVTDGSGSPRVPLRTIYLLEDGSEFRVTRLSTREGVFALLQASYSLYRADDTAAAVSHMEQCADVASRADVRRLVRPRSLDRLEELAAFIESDQRR